MKRISRNAAKRIYYRTVLSMWETPRYQDARSAGMWARGTWMACEDLRLGRPLDDAWAFAPDFFCNRSVDSTSGHREWRGYSDVMDLVAERGVADDPHRSPKLVPLASRCPREPPV